MNLPTHTRMSSEDVQAVARAIRENAR
jgi:dTDP-4-amino-4,6-dideoxygalactose transaminase